MLIPEENEKVNQVAPFKRSYVYPQLWQLIFCVNLLLSPIGLMYPLLHLGQTLPFDRVQAAFHTRDGLNTVFQLSCVRGTLMDYGLLGGLNHDGRSRFEDELGTAPQTLPASGHVLRCLVRAAFRARSQCDRSWNALHAITAVPLFKHLAAETALSSDGLD